VRSPSWAAPTASCSACLAAPPYGLAAPPYLNRAVIGGALGCRCAIQTDGPPGGGRRHAGCSSPRCLIEWPCAQARRREWYGAREDARAAPVGGGTATGTRYPTCGRELCCDAVRMSSVASTRLTPSCELEGACSSMTRRLLLKPVGEPGCCAPHTQHCELAGAVGLEHGGR